MTPLEKNVYSLVLLDDVVDALDKLACERSTSRSGLVNQILAEYLACPTPESRISDIFGCMEKMFSDLDSFQYRGRQSGCMVCFRTSLRFRYHPAVRYSLELFRDSGPYLGELRAVFRTQNPELLEYSGTFFRFWAQLESREIGRRFPGGTIPCSAEPGRWSRSLMWPQSESDRGSESVAKAILAYLGALDGALKTYFADPEAAAEAIRRQYLAYLANAVIL